MSAFRRRHKNDRLCPVPTTSQYLASAKERRKGLLDKVIAQARVRLQLIASLSILMNGRNGRAKERPNKTRGIKSLSGVKEIIRRVYVVLLVSATLWFCATLTLGIFQFTGAMEVGRQGPFLGDFLAMGTTPLALVLAIGYIVFGSVIPRRSKENAGSLSDSD